MWHHCLPPSLEVPASLEASFALSSWVPFQGRECATAPSQHFLQDEDFCRKLGTRGISVVGLFTIFVLQSPFLLQFRTCSPQMITCVAVRALSIFVSTNAIRFRLSLGVDPIVTIRKSSDSSSVLNSSSGELLKSLVVVSFIQVRIDIRSLRF